MKIDFTFIYIFLVIILTIELKGQTFNVDVQLDTSYDITLKKNQTYMFTTWNGFSERNCIIDSGTYQRSQNKITFTSIKKRKCGMPTTSFDGKTFYIKTSKYKECTNCIMTRKKWYSTKVKVLTIDQNG